MSKPVTIRPWLGVGIYAAASLASIAALGSVVATGDWELVARVAPVPIALLGVGAVTLVTPAVVFHDDEVEVRNPLRTTVVPYGRVNEVSTHRGFTLVTEEGPVSAWAAPPPDRLSAERREPSAELRRDPRVRRDASGRVASSAAPGSPSGDAALTLADRLRRRSATGRDAAPIERRWNLCNLALLVITLGAATTLAVVSLG